MHYCCIMFCNPQQLQRHKKTLIIGALGYFIFPLDLVPDFIPIAGFADDATALVAVIKMVFENITPAIKEKARNKSNEIFA